MLRLPLIQVRRKIDEIVRQEYAPGQMAAGRGHLAVTVYLAAGSKRNGGCPVDQTKYENWQNFEMENRPELRETVNGLFKLVFPGRLVPGELKQFIFTAASLASGCTHCQSHGSYNLHRLGGAAYSL